jgi:hypothetical protein
LLAGDLEAIKNSYGLMYLSLYGDIDKLISFCQVQGFLAVSKDVFIYRQLVTFIDIINFRNICSCKKNAI